MASFGVIGSTLIDLGFCGDALGFFTELVAVLVLLSLIVFRGVFASFRLGKRTVELVDAGIAAIPGIGAVYRSLRRMGDIALESGLENVDDLLEEDALKRIRFDDEPDSERAEK